MALSKKEPESKVSEHLNRVNFGRLVNERREYKRLDDGVSLIRPGIWWKALENALEKRSLSDLRREIEFIELTDADTSDKFQPRVIQRGSDSE